MKKKQLGNILISAALVLILAGCGSKKAEERPSYQQITQAEAQRIMDEEEGYIILDVRRQDEFDAGHIPGAILIPNESIDKERPEELPDLDQTILVYCRSGNRSKQASQKLADMGYTDIKEFGGINTWPGEIVTAEDEAVSESVTSGAIRNGSTYSPKEITILKGEEVMDETDLLETGLSNFLLHELEKIGQGQVDFLNNNYEEPPFKCTEYKILKADMIETGTAGLNDSVSIVRYLIGLIPDEYPETLHWNYSYYGDYVIWDAAPTYLIYCTFDEGTPISHLIWTLTEDDITHTYATESNIANYGNRYRAAAMESFNMYKRFVSVDGYDQFGFNYDRDWMETGVKLTPEAKAVIEKSTGKSTDKVEYAGSGYIYEARYIVYLADDKYYVLPYTPDMGDMDKNKGEEYKPFLDPIAVFSADEITDPQAMVFKAAGGILDVDCALISDLNIPYGPGSKYQELYNSSFGMPEVTKLESGYSEGSYFYKAEYKSVMLSGYYPPEADGTDIYQSIETTSSFFHTYRGIKVGSAVEDIKAAYPDIRYHEYTKDEPEEYYWYCANEEGFGPNLCFYIENDKVVKMSAFNFFN